MSIVWPTASPATLATLMFVAPASAVDEKVVAGAVVRWVASGMAVMTRLSPPPKPDTILPTLKLAEETTWTSVTFACAPTVRVWVLQNEVFAKSVMKYSSCVPNSSYGP